MKKKKAKKRASLKKRLKRDLTSLLNILEACRNDEQYDGVESDSEGGGKEEEDEEDEYIFGENIDHVKDVLEILACFNLNNSHVLKKFKKQLNALK